MTIDGGVEHATWTLATTMANKQYRFIVLLFQRGDLLGTSTCRFPGGMLMNNHSRNHSSCTCNKRHCGS